MYLQLFTIYLRPFTTIYNPFTFYLQPPFTIHLQPSITLGGFKVKIICHLFHSLIAHLAGICK